MFESQAFQSWIAVIAGALVFATLFVFLGALSDVVLGGELQLSQKALSLGALAFVGYVGVATFLRANPGQK